MKFGGLNYKSDNSCLMHDEEQLPNSYALLDIPKSIFFHFSEKHLQV